MTYSMTAFARVECNISVGKLIIELRSVNHRYLDLNFRLSDALRELETVFRDEIKKQLSRGKVDINARLELSAANSVPEINQELANNMFELHHKLYDISPEIAPIDFLQLLKWPGMLLQKELNISATKNEIITALQQCLTQLIDTRAREGRALTDAIIKRLDDCQKHISVISERYPKQAILQKNKLQARLAECLQTVDATRVEQEIVILSQKLDIAEEVDRLTTHIKEFQRILNSKGQAGRRMDFLLQEMNREANTMASKSIDAKIQHAVVDVKVLLEQIREQVQNIE